MKKQITEAIKNFDIDKLETLLDDNKSYQDVSKALFIKTLNKKFKSAKKDGCNSFDDIFFGICTSCNKGCEAMTFLSNSGHYLDLFIESKDGETADDIYVCNKLTNFIDLEKSVDLGFSFGVDEKYDFKPDAEFLILKEQYELLLTEVSKLDGIIKLDDLNDWYFNNFEYLSKTINSLDPFECLAYDVYNKAANLTSQIERVFKLSKAATQASESLIDYQFCISEKQKVIWFFQNQKYHYGAIYDKLSDDWRTNSTINYELDPISFILDISGYEYVLDYFIILDNLYDELMEKYKPLPEHFGASESGSIEYSLENYLRLHNKHLDVVKEYGRKGY
ncbi:hypothetical protein DCS32_15500 [Dokdonia sp. Dokd-P16]|uniref:hypothetical protein n=1 Tax=Dokdonia sp. Dokd-P16 TaxID=2173169 RepID=UPI000D54AAD3|nr:hypothetical protein [Dokdonia sp. Dokd-P16]AWH75516.1 hypothetical protein DCS32_15500 [Dokdonia sp. Dokd-P16]